MGLESVEMVMDVEDTFGIHLETPGDIVTVGNLYDCIKTQLHTCAEDDRCATQRAFYKLRRHLVENWGANRAEIRPASRTADVFPVGRRRRMWERLACELSSAFERLGTPSWFVLLMIMSVMILVPLGPFLTSGSATPGPGAYLFWAVLCITLVIVGTRKLTVVIPEQCETLGGLAKAMARANFALDTADQYSDKEIWDILCNIIAENLGANAGDLKQDTEFVRDLNC